MAEIQPANSAPVIEKFLKSSPALGRGHKVRRLDLGSSLPALLFIVVITTFVILGYLNYIPRTVFYAGMRPDFNVGKLSYGIVLWVISVSAIFFHRGNYLPKIFAWIFFILSNLTYFLFYEADPIISGLNVFGFVVFSFLFTEKYISKVEISEKLVELCFWMTLASGLYFFASNGFRFNKSLFLFEGVYDVRFEVTGGRNFLENMLFSTTTKLFSLLALGYYVYRGNWKRAAIVVSSIALMYSTSAQKSILFFAAIAFVISYGGRSARAGRLVALGLTALIAILCIVPQVEGSPSWSAHAFLTRRLLLIPAWLNEQYIQRYDGHPLLLSHSILNGVFGSYSGPGPTWEMGYYLWGFRTSLNNGVFSDGFINFGYAGAVGYLLMAYGAFLFMGRFNHPAIRGVLVVYIWQCTNSALVTTFVTHGLGLFMVLGAYVFMRKGDHAARG